jgi:hypothetical protein
MKQVTPLYPIIFALLFSSAAIARSPVRFQSHWIGEPTADFLKDEPGVFKRLADCHDIQTNSDAWVKKDHPELAADAPYDPDESTQKEHRKQFTEAVENLLTERGCSSLFQALDSKGHASLLREDPLAQPTPATVTGWVFDSGLLTSIRVEYERASYAQAADDVTQKLGKPTIEKLEPFQNGYGATWNNQIADWLTSDLHARLKQRNDPANPRLWLTIESRAAYDAEIQQQKNRPSSLD